MDASSREALLHQAMDRFLHRVREWKASSSPYTTDRDVCIAHKEGLYRLFRDSGLQPWEYHTMLHRALEYGLIAPELRDLWSEVSTTFLQSFSEHRADFLQQHPWGAPGSQFNKNSSMANGNGNAYGGQWLHTNGRSSSVPARPPGLEPKQQLPGYQQHSNSSSSLTAGARSPADTDTARGSASDQQNSRKQQQTAAGGKQAGRAAAGKAGSSGAPATAKGYNKQQQQQQHQQSAAVANGISNEHTDLAPSSAGNHATAAASSKAGPDLLPNGYIAAWRRDLGPTPPSAFAAASMPGQQQQQQQQQQGSAGEAYSTALSGGGNSKGDQQQHGAGRASPAPPAAAGSWDVQEPLYLLPSGLLDDVYDQVDAVVDAPLANGNSSSITGPVSRAPAGAPSKPGSKQQQGKQQQRQAKQPPQQQQALAAAPAGEQQHTQQQSSGWAGQQLQNGQQQQQRPISHDGSAAAVAVRPAGKVNYAAVAAAPPHPPQHGTVHPTDGNTSNTASSYKNSLGVSAAPGGPVQQLQQQQQQKAPGPANGSNSGGQAIPLYHPPGTAPIAVNHFQQQQPPPPPPAAGSKGAASPAPPAAVHLDPPAAAAAAGHSTEDAVVPPPVAPTLSNLSLFHTASLDSHSPVTPAVGGPMSPYPSPLQRSVSTSAGASPAMHAMGLAGGSGSSTGSNNGLAGMAPMLLPPAAVPAAGLGAIGEPVGSFGSNSSSRLAQLMNGHQQLEGQVKAWSSFGPAVTPPAAPTGDALQQQQQQQQMPVGLLGSVGTGRLAAGNADGSTSSAASSITAPTANSVASTPHSKDQSAVDTASSLAAAAGVPGAVMQQQPPPPPPRSSSLEIPQQQQTTAAEAGSSGQQQAAAMNGQQQPPPPPAKPMTWAQKLLAAKANSMNAASNAAAGAAAAAAHGPHGPRIAPAPLSETQQLVSAAAAARRSVSGSTGQALLAAAKQQELEAEAAAAAAVPSYSEAAALDGLDAVTAKAAVTAASRMPLPAKMIQAWRSGLCLTSCVKLLQSQRPDLAMAINERIKGWLCQDCDRSTAECLVLFVLTNLRRDWHLTAKVPGAFLMGLLQHRAALIGGSGMSRKLLEVARNFPNVAVYIDSDVLQELGDMEPSLRTFIMDEYMCKQRHDWPEGLKFPSQCLLSCMRSIRYADPAVHRAYINLMETRPDLGKAMNGVILYGLCKCDAATGLAAVKRLAELPADWTSAARVNASAFLYQKVQELCGGHCY